MNTVAPCILTLAVSAPLLSVFRSAGVGAATAAAAADLLLLLLIL